MFPIHISLVQVCSLNRKFLGCWIQLDYCNLVFFPSHCISEQPLSDILHHCLSAGAISPSVGLHWNMCCSKNTPPSRLSSSICKWPFTSCESIDQFLFHLQIHCNVRIQLRMQSSFCCLQQRWVGEGWTIVFGHGWKARRRNLWSELLLLPRQPHLQHTLSRATFLAYRVFVAEQMPWKSSPGELVRPSFPWTAWKPAERQFLSWDLLGDLAAAQLCPWWELADPLGHVRNWCKNSMWKLVWKESLCQSALLVPAKDLCQIPGKRAFTMFYIFIASPIVLILLAPHLGARWAAGIFTCSSCLNYLMFWFEFRGFLKL